MDDAGILVFDVNDFDEAYLGHFTWDLKRMAASLALLGFVQGALRRRRSREMIGAYASAYLEQVGTFHHGEEDDEFRLTLDNTEGALHAVLLEARLASRWQHAPADDAIEDDERRFKEGPACGGSTTTSATRCSTAYAATSTRSPSTSASTASPTRSRTSSAAPGFGIGSAGLPAYNLLVEGRSQALENDVVLSMKQGNVAAPSRVVRRRAHHASYFEHPGHRTAISQRALQAHADPWLGWCELRGTGQVVKELSPYEADLDWDPSASPTRSLPLLRCLGQATAKIHCVSDAGSARSWSTSRPRRRSTPSATRRLRGELAEFGADYGERAREDHRLFVDAFRNGEIPGLDEAGAA